VLFLDTSALLKRYVHEAGTDQVLELMTRDADWVASALARTEADVTLCRLLSDETTLAEQRRRLREDWDHFRIVPVDAMCLAEAAETGCLRAVRTLDALHLAAAARLPRPFSFVTFDERQAEAARTMGFDVLGVDGPS
jgi:predicted nucleic acid-binding protein